MTFSEFDLQVNDVVRRLHLVAEADIRDAHGETSARPSLCGVKGYTYEAAVRSEDEDRMAHDEEIEAQRRRLLEP